MEAAESSPPSTAVAAVGGGGEQPTGRKKRSWGGGGGGGGGGRLIDGFSPFSPPQVFWNSRRRSGNGRSPQRAMEEESHKASSTSSSDNPESNKPKDSPADGAGADDALAMEEDPSLSDRRKALFEPLEPTNGKRVRAEDLLPPPDFDTMSYPKGWLVGKKRKLVNVDVVESMRRIAVQEMNRKDREIDGLNEQLEEDAHCLERLQLQLLEERSKRTNVERENAMLQNQVAMLMDMLQEAEPLEEVEEGEPQGDP